MNPTVNLCQDDHETTNTGVFPVVW